MSRDIASFQLFDKDNHLNKNPLKYVFTTEGHLFPVDQRFRFSTVDDWKEEANDKTRRETLVNIETTVGMNAWNHSDGSVSITESTMLELLQVQHPRLNAASCFHV